jgi:hypothetical protein
MKHIKSYKLFENPDAIPWEEAVWRDEDARPFWVHYGRAYIGEPGSNHASMIEMYGLINYEYSGRIWLEKKLISFWNYPEPDELYPVLNSLEVCFRNVWDEDIKIIYNGFKIEVRDKDMYYGECIPVEDYIGSEHSSNIDWKDHIKSPLFKNKKPVNKKRIPISDRNYMYQEKKL